MCGISGLVTSRAQAIPETRVLREMRETLFHRGPDDFGEYIRPLDEKGPFVYLGHRRLSIIDLSGGHQPLSNEDGTIWVTFNGEIYNFIDLRKDLKKRGHRFQTLSDTEVIVHAYEEYQEKCFQYLNGMFSIGIWDGRGNRLLLARDRLGKKPLYYSLIHESFLFASELKAIMAYPAFPRKIDPDSFMKYLFFEFIPCPHTIFENAKKIPPASYLVWNGKEVEIKEYWSPFSSLEKADDLPETEAEQRMIQLLKNSVKRRLISDVPLGIFLSGGIDSSAITALAQEENPGKINTFSISFEDPTFDESKYARLASRIIGTEHHEQKMTPSDLLGIIPLLPDILDEPMADASILPTYLLSKFTREHVTVALGGDGGDELFAGYPTYLAHKFADPYHRYLKLFHPAIDYLGNKLPVSDNNISFDFKVKKFLSGIDYPGGIRNSIWLGSFPFSDLNNTLSTGLRSRYEKMKLVDDILLVEKGCALRDPISRYQYLDMKLYLQESILVKVDRASMACSLEVRAPFLDHELVEFVMGLPSRYKLKGFTSKYLLKKGMEKYIPKEILYRKKKGFGVPIAKWVKGELRELFEELLSPERIKQEGFLDSDSVTRLLQDHLQNKRDNRKQLWTLLVWELWFSRYHPTL